MGQSPSLTSPPGFSGPETDMRSVLVCGRLLQGVGEALILPAGLTILGQALPPERKGWAVGVWSASAAVASAIAPALAWPG